MAIRPAVRTVGLWVATRRGCWGWGRPSKHKAVYAKLGNPGERHAQASKLTLCVCDVDFCANTIWVALCRYMNQPSKLLQDNLGWLPKGTQKVGDLWLVRVRPSTHPSNAKVRGLSV